jgi:hypothetical protein
LASASSNVVSLPGQVGSQTSLRLAVLLRRGSSVMICAPAILLSRMRWACGLK